MIETLMLVLTAFIFGIAAVQDLRHRAVSYYLWIPMAVTAVAANAYLVWTGELSALQFLVPQLVGIAVGWYPYLAGEWGIADARAITALTLALPYYPATAATQAVAMPWHGSLGLSAVINGLILSVAWAYTIDYGRDQKRVPFVTMLLLGLIAAVAYGDVFAALLSAL